MLFALPAASWYFLQSGLNWRKVKAKELVPKNEVIDLEKLHSSSHPLAARLQSSTTLLKVEGPQSKLDKDLVDQFKDAYTFQAIYLGTDQQLQPADQIVNGQFNYLLIDTSGQVRQTYIGTDQEVMTRVVEDIALILPQRKPKDIRMKNNPEID